MDPRHPLVFTGHRIDAPDRTTPRFPSSAEAKARRMIRRAVQTELTSAGTPLCGIAGAASGGDILFHEVCDELNVPTEVHLALSPSDYLEASVAEAGSDWIARFAAVTASRPVHVLPNGNGDSTLTVWDRSNIEMLRDAAKQGGSDVTLLALWNGEGGDGPGGAADMVKRVRDQGGRVVLLDAKKLAEG